ncbi:MAG: hypothetical protein IPM16_20395 [Chloroflexi bacterium]|nr:hypothetical protein [Chloroflexota bacterium]
MSRVDPQRVYGLYQDSFLIGTFNLTDTPRPYQREGGWGGGGGGWRIGLRLVGRGWAMAQADRIAQDGGYAAIRFDGVASNAPLMRFYDSLGYERRGVMDLTGQGWQPVMCYERIFSAR